VTSRGRAAALIASILAAAITAGCGAGTAAAPPRLSLVIFAAASLQPVTDAIASAYAEGESAVDLVFSTDSSAALATKIQEGGPADVFLSADTANAQRLADAGLVDGAVVPFAANTLALIVPLTNPAGLGTPADLARPGVRVIAAGDAVPVTKYAARLTANLATLPGYPPDFVDRYTANVASREDSVAGVLAKVALGEGDAGIVYATDAAASDGVTVIAVPDAANVRALYGGVVVKAGSHREASRRFLAWLVGAEGQAALSTSGFLAP
jgi:molybdate transport system substrate-binding protein